MSKKALFAAVLATTMLVPLAACGSDDKSSSGSGSGSAAPSTAKASPTPAAADLLKAAVTKSSGKNFKFTVPSWDGSGPGDMTGSYEAATKNFMGDSTSEGETVHYVIASDTMYMSGIKEMGDVVLRLQLVKLPDTADPAPMDPLLDLALLSGAVKVESKEAGSFSGTIDASKATATDYMTTRTLKYLNSQAATVPSALAFTATVDANGYISTIKIDLPKYNAGKDAQIVMKLSDYEAAVTIAIPSGANVVDAPAEAYA
jgi:hypothetical protein